MHIHEEYEFSMTAFIFFYISFYISVTIKLYVRLNSLCHTDKLRRTYLYRHMCVLYDVHLSNLLLMTCKENTANTRNGFRMDAEDTTKLRVVH